MSDVFDRIVARATHRAPVLVARRPSRFEATAGTRPDPGWLPGSEREVKGESPASGQRPDESLSRSGGLVAGGRARSVIGAVSQKRRSQK